MSIELLESIKNPIALALTVMVLLYAFVDTPLNRIATHIFIGVAAGYAGAVAVNQVLLPHLSKFNDPEQRISFILGMLWVVLILMKISPKTAVLGNPGSALLVGVGAAVAVGGAIQGTLIPQISGASQFFKIDGAVNLQSFFQGAVILVGTVSSMVYFHFGAKITTSKIPQRNFIIEIIGKIGHVFIAITFGVVFAGVYSAAISALVNRINFIVTIIADYLFPIG